MKSKTLTDEQIEAIVKLHADFTEQRIYFTRAKNELEVIKKSDEFTDEDFCITALSNLELTLEETKKSLRHYMKMKDKEMTKLVSTMTKVVPLKIKNIENLLDWAKNLRHACDSVAKAREAERHATSIHESTCNSKSIALWSGDLCNKHTDIDMNEAKKITAKKVAIAYTKKIEAEHKLEEIRVVNKRKFR